MLQGHITIVEKYLEEAVNACVFPLAFFEKYPMTVRALKYFTFGLLDADGLQFRAGVGELHDSYMVYLIARVLPPDRVGTRRWAVAISFTGNEIEDLSIIQKKIRVAIEGFAENAVEFEEGGVLPLPSV